MSITYYDTLIDESKLKPIRQALYHSQGPGYYVFPQYITKEFTKHIVEFWTKEIIDKHKKTHKPFKSKNHFLYNCPNFVGFSGPELENVTYYNFFWNAPPEQVTYGVSFQIQILRNLIEANPIFNEIFPLDGISATFRVVNT
ncbi:MAG: hypothetical protein IIA88_02900, partial [Bacteroidetes bacterium]|nr:hypothetical protein [Bacteroidota bacterium]